MPLLRAGMTICLAFFAMVASVSQLNAADTKGFASPEACFQQFLERSEKGNAGELLPCLTDIYQDFLAGQTAFTVERECFFNTEKSKACLEVLKKYKHDKTDIMGLLQIYDSPGRPGAHVAMIFVGSAIKDKPAFFKDAEAALGTAEAKEDAKEIEKAAEARKTAKLKDLKIEGNVATAVVANTNGETPIVFRKVDGGWRIAIDANESKWREAAK